eukprot:10507150-Lingulodinium_polyedra.AAC.1
MSVSARRRARCWRAFALYRLGATRAERLRKPSGRKSGRARMFARARAFSPSLFVLDRGRYARLPFCLSASVRLRLCDSE